MPCRTCPFKRQRLQRKLNATKERAENWAKEMGLSEVFIYTKIDGDEDDGEWYEYGSTIPDSATIVELLRVH